MISKREERRIRAVERQEARKKRTPQEQLKRLDAYLGEGKGAIKERARLKIQIEAGQPKTKKEVII